MPTHRRLTARRTTRFLAPLQWGSTVRAILRWYRTHRRSLPWRQTRDPYRIWVSEMMLQQTQVNRVIPYYKRFLKRFPTLAPLSRARWSAVLSVWDGLGYYARAQNMLRTARLLVSRNNCRFPKRVEALTELPGIGPYTAAAIACFAFGEPLPAIDTNVRRILSRISGMNGRPLEKFARELFALEKNAPQELNHALMDLGATICRSRTPKCFRCPIQRNCVFRKKMSRAEEIRAYARSCSSSEPRERAQPTGALKKPVRGQRRKPKTIDVGVACIHRNGSYLICKRRKSRGGQWEFPGGKREPKESIRDCLKREVREEIRVQVAVRRAFLVHEYTEHGNRWRLHFCRCQILRGTPTLTEHTAMKWITPRNLMTHPFPKANRKAVKKLLEMR